MSSKKISALSGIDEWFLDKMRNIVDTEKELEKAETLDAQLMLRAKKQGFSDKQIGILYKRSVSGGSSIFSQSVSTSRERVIRDLRKKMNILPHVKQIDTLAAEYPAKTNYLYLTYHAEVDDTTSAHEVIKGKLKKKQRGRPIAIVLGSGPYCIGSSVEFDWCCVNAARVLKEQKYETIMINYNPETVSTDYDMCDKLYFDELSLERVLDIYEKENPDGVVISMGGQVPNNLAMKLHEYKVKIMGTSPRDIDRAENRHTFSKLLDTLEIDQPEWNEFAKV